MVEQVIYQEHQYEIIKHPNTGFGIAISGGRDNPAVRSGNPAIVISDVVPHGPAFNKLRVGDTVTHVNNRSTQGMTHPQVIREMKSSGRRLLIAVKRRAVVYVDSRRTPSPIESRYSRRPRSRSRGRSYSRSRSVTSRHSRYRSPSSSSYSPSPRRTPPRRSRSRARSVGYSRSQSRTRSRRRSVSSHSSLSSERSLSPPRRMTRKLSLEDRPQPGVPALSPDPPGSKGGPDVMVFPVKSSQNRHVLLKKTGWNNSYGLKLGIRFFIQDIHPGSLADQHPDLRKGDTILEINGRKLDNKDMQEVLQYIGLSKDKLAMVVKGDDGGTVSIPVSGFAKPQTSKSFDDLRDIDRDDASSYSRRKR